MDLHIIHIPKKDAQGGRDISALSPLVFETCLRQLVFVNSEDAFNSPEYNQISDIAKNVELYRHDKAYQFALEVICGLHSLIKGETEVFGQFKDFCSNHKNHVEALGLTETFKQLLTDCKNLRATRIQNWSHNTYGSVTRKLLNANDSVALLGSGQLAQEIAPWLKQVKSKSVLVRRPRSLEPAFSQFRVEMTDASIPSLETSVLIVAADISNKELDQQMHKWPNLRMVIDWRGDESWTAKNNETVFRLHDLKENKEKSQADQLERIQLVHAEIEAKAREYSKKSKHNPWGWEDFCA